MIIKYKDNQPININLIKTVSRFGTHSIKIVYALGPYVVWYFDTIKERDRVLNKIKNKYKKLFP